MRARCSQPSPSRECTCTLPTHPSIHGFRTITWLLPRIDSSNRFDHMIPTFYVLPASSQDVSPLFHNSVVVIVCSHSSHPFGTDRLFPLLDADHHHRAAPDSEGQNFLFTHAHSLRIGQKRRKSAILSPTSPLSSSQQSFPFCWSNNLNHASRAVWSLHFFHQLPFRIRGYLRSAQFLVRCVFLHHGHYGMMRSTQRTALED